MTKHMAQYTLSEHTDSTITNVCTFVYTTHKHMHTCMCLHTFTLPPSPTSIVQVDTYIHTYIHTYIRTYIPLSVALSLTYVHTPSGIAADTVMGPESLAATLVQSRTEVSDGLSPNPKLTSEIPDPLSLQHTSRQTEVGTYIHAKNTL